MAGRWLALSSVYTVIAVAAIGAPPQETTMSFVGKTIEIRYESGLSVKARYESPTELEWEALAGPAKGQKGTETIEAVEVAPDVFFISWLEKNGISVSNVIDLGRMRAFAFVTFDAEGGRQASFDQGTISVLPE